MSEKSYWDGTGKYQDLYEKLNELIPSEGECTGSNTQKLDKLRRAANCYYDLYNNGLCNRAAEFWQVFGFGGTYLTKEYPISPELEAALDEIILAAAKEQNVE